MKIWSNEMRPLFQPRTLRDGSEDKNIRALAPELIVVVAYGCILPKPCLLYTSRCV